MLENKRFSNKKIKGLVHRLKSDNKFYIFCYNKTDIFEKSYYVNFDDKRLID